MTHYWSKLVSDYIDGELSQAAAVEVERHLWACQECRVLLRDFRAIVAAVQEQRQNDSMDAVATRAPLELAVVTVRNGDRRFTLLAPRLEC